MRHILGILLGATTLLSVGGARAAEPAPEIAAEILLSKTPIIDGHNDTPEQLRELFGNDFAKFDLQALPADILA